ncbi:MAG: 30S ribosomal protein S6 [Spirochaetes bacterium]|nr:30S ribosomal protein S6 [Spirochaetota bacterium]
MKKYELMIIFDSQNDSAVETTEPFEVLLKSHDIKVESKEDIGNRKLAYEINKKSEGHYWNYFLEADEQSMQPFNNELLIQDYLMRHLVTIRS